MTIEAKLFKPEGHHLDPPLIAAAFAWTHQQPERTKLVVAHAKKTLDTSTLGPIYDRFRFPVTTPRTRHQDRLPAGPSSVIAIWPIPDVLDLAIDLAHDGSLAILSYPQYDISGQLAALGLTTPSAMSPEALTLLDRTIESCEHNGFIGTPDKEMTVRALREILATTNPPSPEDIYQHALGRGVRPNHAGTLRTYAQEILQGKKHVDYRRQPI